jgi:hypothetical protein
LLVVPRSEWATWRVGVASTEGPGQVEKLTVVFTDLVGSTELRSGRPGYALMKSLTISRKSSGLAAWMLWPASIVTNVAPGIRSAISRISCWST